MNSRILETNNQEVSLYNQVAKSSVEVVEYDG